MICSRKNWKKPLRHGLFNHHFRGMGESYEPMDIEIFEEDEQLWTTSLDVADKFGKRHNNLLMAYEKLKPDISEKFSVLNFKRTSYMDTQKKERPMIKMTRSGFSMLVLGFSGKKAIKWREKYIMLFDSMEKVLIKTRIGFAEARALGKIARRAETDIIKVFVEYATDQGSQSAQMYYMTITKMTYRALELVKKGLKVPDGFRDLLESRDLSFLNTAEHICAAALEDGIQRQMYYKEIYKLAKERVERFAEHLPRKQIAS